MTEKESADSSGSNISSICLIVLVVGTATGVNLWLHRGDLQLGYARYSGYGFSFIYPELLETHSWGYPDSSQGPSDFGGVVQVKRFWEGVWENFWVTWYTDIGTPDHEAELDEFYRNMDSWGCLTDDQGELIISEKNGRVMLIQTYTFWEDSFRPGGSEFVAASALWYQPWASLHANRVYLLTYVAFSESTTRQQVLEGFQGYLDSFLGLDPTN